jgi:AraC-like DNA-binding protein/tetratricopeptide (TPR) repeat protein
MTEPLTKNQMLIQKLTEIIHTNLKNENFGVKELAHFSGMSPSSLNRKLQTINKKSINQFIREVRLIKALEMLQNEDLTANEVSYRTGFSSPAYFNSCFHEFFGFPPGKVKNRNPEHLEEDIVTPAIERHEQMESRRHISRIKMSGMLFFAILIVIVAFIVWPRLFRRNPIDYPLSAKSRISVAVMPFKNMTNNSDFNIWQDGIQQNLISLLSNSSASGLQVRQKESINTLLRIYGIAEYASISPDLADKISLKLKADIYVYGSIEQAGPILRIDAQLIDTKTKEVFKSFKIEKSSSENNILPVIDTLSQRLRDFLLISKLIKENPEYGRFPLSTNSPEAFRYCIYGDEARNTAVNKNGFSTAIDWYLKALEADSNYFTPMIGLTTAYYMLGMMEENVHWLNKINQKKDKWPIMDQLGAKWAYAYSFEPPEEGIKYLKQIQQIDDQTPGVSYLIGVTYIEKMKEYDKAIPELERAVEIYHKWGVDDSWYYSQLGYAYHMTGQYKKEEKLYKKAEKYVKDDQWIIARRVVFNLAEKDSVAAARYIDKYVSVCKENSISEADINRGLARIYVEADNSEKAEGYYRKALLTEPENPELLNSFANFLSEKNRNLNEFTITIEKALRLAGNKWDYYNYSDTKGYGLFRFGKYQEALEVLQNTWDSTPFKMYFIKSHLEEVKKAVAGQK